MRKLYLAHQPDKPARKISNFEDLQDGDSIDIVELPAYMDVPQDLEDKMEWSCNTVSMSAALQLFIDHYSLPDNTIVQAEIKKLMRME